VVSAGPDRELFLVLLELCHRLAVVERLGRVVRSRARGKLECWIRTSRAGGVWIREAFEAEVVDGGAGWVNATGRGWCWFVRAWKKLRSRHRSTVPRGGRSMLTRSRRRPRRSSYSSSRTWTPRSFRYRRLGAGISSMKTPSLSISSRTVQRGCSPSTSTPPHHPKFRTQNRLSGTIFVLPLLRGFDLRFFHALPEMVLPT